MSAESEAFCEKPVLIAGPDGARAIVGLLTVPACTGAINGVVVVSGGAQNRVGSRRRFVELSRALARAGVWVLRFDPGGVGDSAGGLPSFEEYAPDLQRAVSFLADQLGPGARISLWGHCDGATASLLSAPTLAGVTAIVGLNPFVHTEAGHAKALVGTYYKSRLFDLGLWRKLLLGRLNPYRAFGSFIRNWRLANSNKTSDQSPVELTDRLVSVLEESSIPCLVLVGDDDLTGVQFLSVLKRLSKASAHHVCVERFPGGDHILSDPQHWKRAVERSVAHVLR